MVPFTEKLQRKFLTNSAHIENEELGKYMMHTFFHRGRDIDIIPAFQRTVIRSAILASIYPYNTWQAKIEEELTDNVLGIASYPLVDLTDPRISRKCNWMTLQKTSTFEATILEYFGEHNFRYFCYGKKEAIQKFLLSFPQTENGREMNEDDFRIVIPSWQFSEEELPGLLGNSFQLREKPEEVTRMVKRFSPSEVLPTISLPEGYEVIELHSANEETIRSLPALLENYPHHSVHLKGNNIRTHHIIVDTVTNEALAMSGIIGRAANFGFPAITLTGNLVTKEGHERKGLATAARLATLGNIQKDDLYKNGIIVSDVNNQSVKVNSRLGYRVVQAQSDDGKYQPAKFWWCIYDRV